MGFWNFVKSGSTWAPTSSANTDGTDEYVAAATDGTIGDEDGSDPFSVSIWVKRTSGTWIGLVTHKYDNTASTPGWQILGATDGGSTFVYVQFADGSEVCSAFGTNSGGYETTLPANTWTNVIVTYDGSKALGVDDNSPTSPGGLNIYINGSALAQLNKAWSPGGNSWSGSCSETTSARLCIGRYTTSGTGYMGGNFGHIAKIPWELSAAEVTEIYNGTGASPLLDFTQFSGWNTMKSDARSFWFTWDADTLSSGGSVTDLTDNGYVLTPYNMEAGDKSTDLPT